MKSFVCHFDSNKNAVNAGRSLRVCQEWNVEKRDSMGCKSWGLFKHLVSPYCKRLSVLLYTGYIRYLSRALNVPRLVRVGSLPFEMFMVPWRIWTSSHVATVDR